MTKLTATFSPELADAAGAITFWNMAGTCALSALKHALEEAGTQDCPPPPSESTRLQRTADTLTGRAVFRRRHPRGGHALVEENVGFVQDAEVLSDEPNYRVIARVYIKSVDVQGPNGKEKERRLAVDTKRDGWEEAVKRAWEEQGETLAPEDVGTWLSGHAGNSCAAISLRNRGGVYFVPRDSLARWRATTKAIASVMSASVYEIPALPTGETLRAVLDSLSREAEEEITGIDDELGRGDVGLRAAETRLARTKRVRDKLRSYAEQLDIDVTGLVDKCDHLSASLTALMASISED